MIITWIIIGILVLLSIYLIIRLRKREQINQQIIEENSKAEQIHTALLEKCHSLRQEVEKAKIQRDEINNGLDLLEKQARESADKFYQQNIEIVKNKFKLVEEELKRNFEQAKEDYNKEYLTILKDSSNIVSLKNQEILQVSQKLDDIQQTMSAAIEAEKRKQAETLEEQKQLVILGL